MSVFRYINSEELEIGNPMFLLNTEVTLPSTDSRSIGFTAKYSTGSALAYTGMFRDPTDSIFKIYQGLTSVPGIDTGVLTTASAGFTLASMDVANFRAFGNMIVNGNFTVNGSISSINVTTLTIEDNIIVANAGPSGTKPDGGFVVRRQPVGIATDAAKESGTAAGVGSTTTLALQANNNHGFTTDYYKGWTVKTGGDVTGTSLITGSSAVNPPVLTLATALSAATSSLTTYQLFNKQNVGTIYSESNQLIEFLGFPREDLVGQISTTGTAGDGNLADFVNVKAKDITAIGDLYVNGVIKATAKFDDNIISTNVGPTNVSQDSGYVSKRTPAYIVVNDLPKLAAVPIQTNYVSGATTIVITSATSGVNYFKNWVIRYNSDTVNAVTVLSSTNAASVHTLILSAGFPVALASSTDKVDLYNKTFVGTVFRETTNTLLHVGFPREEGESIIDPVSPINGNIPDYINTSAQDVNVKGYLYLNSATVINTKTQITATAFTAADVMFNDVIYLNPTADSTFTMPSVASVTLSANRSKPVILINLSAFSVTIAANGSDMFEVRPTLLLSRQYSKTVLIVSSEIAGTWFIKG
jgi:hypothetical protein